MSMIYECRSRYVRIGIKILLFELQIIIMRLLFNFVYVFLMS